MLKTYKPKYEDLWFRKLMLSDLETMSYNHAYGGTIDFNEDKWETWYNKWIDKEDRYYRYLVNEENEFVGEIAYYLDIDKYIANIIIYSKYRNKGYGTKGIKILCDTAKESNIDVLYDDIAIDNKAIKLFLNNGFIEESRNEKIVMLKKYL